MPDQAMKMEYDVLLHWEHHYYRADFQGCSVLKSLFNRQKISQTKDFDKFYPSI